MAASSSPLLPLAAQTPTHVVLYSKKAHVAVKPAPHKQLPDRSAKLGLWQLLVIYPSYNIARPQP
jgi:hypothetical protein